jgi:selenocysteine lyase/cysteine desulfurase
VTFVPNATLGVNTVFRNLQYEDGDYILYFATIYKGCHATVEYITETTPAKAARVEYTYPVEDDWLVDAFKQKVEEVKSAGGKVKVAIFDTVVSMPGVRVPYERLLSACKELGVLSLLDAAHGIGHLDLDVTKLDPDFMTTNCHKYVPPPSSPLSRSLTRKKMAPRPPRLRTPLRAPAKPTPHPLNPPHLLGVQNPQLRA